MIQCPSNCAVALASLRHLEKHPELVTRLNSLSNYARDCFKTKGVKIIEAQTPIIPIYTYEVEETLIKAKQIYEAGVYTNPVLPPATNPGECLLRTSYMASLNEALIDEATDIIASHIVNQ